MQFLKELILFIFTYIFCFLIYLLFVVKKAKKMKNLKKNSYQPMEVIYLVNKYNLDLEKVDYNNLLIIISLVSSFDISVIVTILLSVKNYILLLIIGFISVIFLILLSYHMVYLVYKKKGMIKDESKRNRK